MEHDELKHRVLDRGWTHKAMEEAAALLGHVRECPECSAALADYDQVREILAQTSFQAEPQGGMGIV